jgi:hypothetical protein
MDALPDTFDAFLRDHDPEAYRRNPAFRGAQSNLRARGLQSRAPEGHRAPQKTKARSPQPEAATVLCAIGELSNTNLRAPSVRQRILAE